MEAADWLMVTVALLVTVTAPAGFEAVELLVVVLLVEAKSSSFWSVPVTLSVS